MTGPPSIRQQITAGPVSTVLEFFWYITAPVVLPMLVSLPFLSLSELLFSDLYLGAVPGLPLAVATSLLVLCSLGIRRYPVLTFGTHRDLTEETFVYDQRRCAECEMQVDRGQTRRYAEQVVAFGCPLYTKEWGENAYCPWCADGLESPSQPTEQSASQTVKLDSHSMAE